MNSTSQIRVSPEDSPRRVGRCRNPVGPGQWCDSCNDYHYTDDELVQMFAEPAQKTKRSLAEIKAWWLAKLIEKAEQAQAE